jgi:transcriptional regulator with XRE-family HTH domain
MDKKLIGYNIKKVRQAKALTQVDLAEKIEISRTYMSDIERGAKNPGINTLIKIADTLDVDISKIMGETTLSGKKEHILDIEDKLISLSDAKYRLVMGIMENIFLLIEDEEEKE